MKIAEQTIHDVKRAVNIVDIISRYVNLKRRGVNYLGICPFHDEKTPSFTVNPAKGFFKCFGCGKSGDAIKFVMEYEKKTYPEAIELIAGLNNILLQTDNGIRKPQKALLRSPKKIVKEPSSFDTIPAELLPASFGDILRNPLIKRFAAVYGVKIVNDVCNDYGIIIKNNWLVIPQRDIRGKYRTAKGIRYEESGHRDHTTNPIWLHVDLKRKGLLKDDFKLKQCFSGEHLLSKYPEKTIGIVEGQSTMIFMACLSLAAINYQIKSLEYFTRFIWICTGGSDGIGWKNVGVSDPLRFRKSILFPDAGFYNKWKEDSEEMKKKGLAIGVSDLIEKKFSEGLLKYNDDLRDYLESFTDDIKRYCSPVVINEDQVKEVKAPSISGDEFGNLSLYEVVLNDGSLFEILADESGEIITTHERLDQFSSFYKRELQPGKFNGVSCLLRIIKNLN